MTFLKDTIKGILIGVANIIPGVSGGTMAVSLGIYDKLISSVSGLLKDWKKSLAVLSPIILGCGIGIVGFTYAIEYLLSHHTFVTCMAFTGLILGGIPVLVSSLKQELRKASSKIGFSGILAFLLLFGVAAFLPMMNADEEVLKTFSPTPAVMISLFFVGVVASATMVVPGVSGSMVLMLMGFYQPILDAIKSFFTSLAAMDMDGILTGLGILVPFGIGIVIGVFAIAKLVEIIFKKFPLYAYYAIIGLIVASPFAIYLMGKFPAVTAFSAITGVLALVAGFFVAYKLGE